MAKADLMEFLNRTLGPFFEENGYSLWYQEFVKEGKDWTLRITAEKAETDADGNRTGALIPVDTDDCEKISRYLSAKLDEADPIEQNYILEVSSPGMDRELRTPEHFRRMIGETVDVSLYRPLNGEKKGPKLLTGVLRSFDGKTITVDDTEIPLDSVAKVALNVGF